MQAEKITSKMPMWLTGVTLLLFLMRLGVWLVESKYGREPEGIQWQMVARSDIQEGRAYQSRPVLYYFCDDNSEVSRRLNSGPLLNRQVVKLVQEKFLPVKAASRLRGETIKELQEKFSIAMCPAFLVTLPDGQPIGSLSSLLGVNSRSLLSFLQFCQLRQEYVIGIDQLAHGHYDAAALALEAWLNKVQKIDTQYINGALFCALAETMTFKNKAVEITLEKIKNKSYSNDSNWPAPIEQFLLGRISADDLIRLANSNQSHVAQALFYRGMLEIRGGQFDLALNDLREGQKSVSNSEPEVRALMLAQIARLDGRQ